MTQNGKSRKPFNILRVDDIPSMVGKSDVAVIERHLDLLPANAVILEFGPWLGGVTARLARHGSVHVVDNFIWTAQHAKRIENLLVAGASFKEVFSENLAALGCSATIHEMDFEDFNWPGPIIDCCMIDAPKTPELALTIFKAIAGWTTPATLILFKNALNPAYPALVELMGKLVAGNVLVESTLPAPASCNTLACYAGPEFAKAEEIAKTATPETATRSDRAFQVVQLAKLLGESNWTGAYELLSNMEPSTAAQTVWPSIVKQLNKRVLADPNFATFADMFDFHHSSAGMQPGAISLSRSHSHLLRAYWTNNAGKPWRGRSFHPALLQAAFDYGYIGWPSKVQAIVRGKDILDIGCGPGLHGLGYLAAGANSYLGADPIVKLDKDHVKNLARKTKEPFGWSPREIATLVEPWRVTPELIQTLPADRAFDVATLHNVTEHLIHIEDVFREIALRLRPGGIILYNHHNFYTWNGHHLPPKTVAAIVPGDAEQMKYTDWAHIAYRPEPDHYIARGLNRIKLDDLLALTSKYFDIQSSEEILARPENGSTRLTDDIRRRYPDLTDRDFLTQNLLVTASVKL
ncbi:class I SAM-dependent methyltransferase [Pseudotabrizicola algicola]|uniref:Methyltransferase domain-containing protein n=1 Tax=Pseudotabrizicola algicola TaxID=2709381 RepID=A0A6B3RL58_9RHOB|nr:methyltransferase domain-containing protein [Pseudotabrizicola algicola]NEX45863.1 methyltransferase domain-containing protein [Pseudotabrizicola algicola]